MNYIEIFLKMNKTKSTYQITKIKQKLKLKLKI